MASVKLRDIRKTFGQTEVLRGIDLEIEDREFVVFVGPSGCGKSTLLRLIAGLEEITAGDLLIDDVRVNDTPPDRRGLAMVFQSYALYPHMTVADNMGFSLRLAGAKKDERDRKVREAARVLQLEPLLDRKPRELSGGQRQRVAIGRAIVRNPKVFLFDEPLSNLDAGLRVQMRIEIARLHESLDVTMIYVTHDQVEAMTLADRIVVLRDGAIEQTGTPLDLYNHPRNIFVAEFIGSPRMNLLPVRVKTVSEGEVTVTLPDGGALALPIRSNSLKADEEVLLGIRPEHLRLSERGQLAGQVMVVERLGSETHLYIQTQRGEMLTLKAEGQSAARTHDRVRVEVKSEYSHLFDQAGGAIVNGL